MLIITYLTNRSNTFNYIKKNSTEDEGETHKQHYKELLLTVERQRSLSTVVSINARASHAYRSREWKAENKIENRTAVVSR